MATAASLPGCRAPAGLNQGLPHPTESGKCRVRLGATCRCVGQSEGGDSRILVRSGEIPRERISHGRTTQKNGGGDGRRVLLTYKCRQALRHPSRHGIGTHQQKVHIPVQPHRATCQSYGQNAPGNDACRNGCIVG